MGSWTASGCRLSCNRCKGRCGGCWDGDGACALPLAKAQAFCRDLLALWPALWTFVTIEGVEPTNNAAERALRPAVLWRKGCFGAQSDAGNLFVARILTASATCRQQERPLLTILTE